MLSHTSIKRIAGFQSSKSKGPLRGVCHSLLINTNRCVCAQFYANVMSKLFNHHPTLQHNFSNSITGLVCGIYGGFPSTNISCYNGGRWSAGSCGQRPIEAHMRRRRVERGHASTKGRRGGQKYPTRQEFYAHSFSAVEDVLILFQSDPP